MPPLKRISMPIDHVSNGDNQRPVRTKPAIAEAAMPRRNECINARDCHCESPSLSITSACLSNKGLRKALGGRYVRPPPVFHDAGAAGVQATPVGQGAETMHDAKWMLFGSPRQMRGFFFVGPEAQNTRARQRAFAVVFLWQGTVVAGHFLGLGFGAHRQTFLKIIPLKRWR